MGENVVSIGHISAEEINRVMNTYRDIEKTEADDSTFMIIKPFGLEHACSIIESLKRKGVEILKSATIDDWSGLALFLYLGNKGEAAEIGIARNKAHSLVETENRAIYLQLEAVPRERLAQIKSELRREHGGFELKQFLYNGKYYFLKLDSVHAPDPERQGIESRVIRHYFSSTTSIFK